MLHDAAVAVCGFEACVLLVPAEGSEQWGTQWDGVGPALHLCGKLTDLCSSAFVLTQLVRFALRILTSAWIPPILAPVIVF